MTAAPHPDQFDDAPDDDTAAPAGAPQPSAPRIDDDAASAGEYEQELSAWYAQHGISPGDEEEYEEEDEDEYEEEGLSAMGTVEDADWEMARGGECASCSRWRALAGLRSG
jgi:hypothetical protein